MDFCFEYRDNKPTNEDQLCLLMVEQLKGARKKLTPIVDHVIRSTLSSKQKRGNHTLKYLELSSEEYRDIVMASKVLEEWHLKSNKPGCDLPNTNIIVNHVKLTTSRQLQDKSVVIDEILLLELLELYERMGVVIQRMSSDGDNNSEPSGKQIKENPYSSSATSDFETKKSPNSSHHSKLTKGSSVHVELTPTEDDKSEGPTKQSTHTSLKFDTSAHVVTPVVSEMSLHHPDLSNSNMGSFKMKQEENDSTESSVGSQKDGSTNLNIKSTESDKQKKNDEETSIFIKIKCCSRSCDSDMDGVGTVIKCAGTCSSNYHIRLNGEPVLLKLNQNNVEDGTVYCINTGADCEEDEIKIIIKQCPECRSTIIGSTTGITDVREGTTPSSFTDNIVDEPFPVGPNQSKSISNKSDPFSKNLTNQSDYSSKHSSKSAMNTSDSQVPPSRHSSKSATNKSPSIISALDIMGESHESITLHGKQGDETKMVDSSDEESVKHQSSDKLKSASGQPKIDVLIDTNNVEQSIVHILEEPLSPLLRRRICSSMEFDVNTVHTRLRKHGIEHKNSKIVLELKTLGVDNILRACRPAKCCRKAILNEKQKTALPYCVSLKSLPLLANDVEIIKQSIEMSRRRMKVAPNVSDVNKDSFAYYISLEDRNGFIPDKYSSWVVPVYDVKSTSGISNQNNGKIFVLKNPNFLPKQVNSINKLLMIPNGKNLYDVSNTFRILRKLLWEKTNVFNDVWNEDFNPVFVEEYEQFDITCTKRKNKRHLSKKTVSKVYPTLNSQQTDRKGNSTTLCRQKSLEGGDYPLSFDDKKYKSLCKGFVCARNKKTVYRKKKAQTSQKKKLVSVKSMSCVSGKIFYIPNREVFIRKCRSLESILHHMQSKRIHKRHIYSKTVKSDKMRLRKVLSATTASEKLHFYKNYSDTVINKPRTKVTDENMQAWHRRNGRKDQELSRNKLEIYVDLIDGDLVWGNSLPLKPINYNTYYNHQNQQQLPKVVRGGPVLDPMHVTRVSPNMTSRGSIIPTPVIEPDVPDNTDKITISEITPEHFRLLYKNSTETIQESQRQPEFFSLYLLGPESQDQPWVPHVVSQTSLPTIQEEVIKLKQVPKLQSTPPRENVEKEELSVENSDNAGSLTEKPQTQETSKSNENLPIEKQKVKESPRDKTKPAKNKCSVKSVCLENKCIDCKSGECKTKKKKSEGSIHIYIQSNRHRATNKDLGKNQGTKKHEDKNKIIEEVEDKDNLSEEIEDKLSEKIEDNSTDIEKTEDKNKKALTVKIKENDKQEKNIDQNKNKKKADEKLKRTVYINDKEVQPCNKDICELYKNKNIARDKKPCSNKAKSTGSEQCLTIKAGEKLEIYINNQKGPCHPKCKKFAKEKKMDKTPEK